MAPVKPTSKPSSSSKRDPLSVGKSDYTIKSRATSDELDLSGIQPCPASQDEPKSEADSAEKTLVEEMPDKSFYLILSECLILVIIW